jgi:hypothetical protein
VVNIVKNLLSLPNSYKMAILLCPLTNQDSTKTLMN